MPTRLWGKPEPCRQGVLLGVDDGLRPGVADESGPAMGVQASDSQYGEIMKSAGFTRFHKTTPTPFNKVFEVRP